MPARDPPIGGLIDESPEHSVRMGVRGGGCIPDRTSLHLKFPAKREKNREFFEIGFDEKISARIRGAKSICCSQIPYAMDQGTNLSKQGKDCPFQQITGNAVASIVTTSRGVPASAQHCYGHRQRRKELLRALAGRSDS